MFVCYSEKYILSFLVDLVATVLSIRISPARRQSRLRIIHQ